MDKSFHKIKPAVLNNPEYIITDEFKALFNDTLAALSLAPSTQVTQLNFQHGYLTELNKTIQEWNESRTKVDLVFPLVWLEWPVRITRNNPSVYGDLDPFRIFIMKDTPEDITADRSIDLNFRSVIWPIYREMMNQLYLKSDVFTTTKVNQIDHTYQDLYFWGEGQKAQLMYPVDTRVVTISGLRVHNNNNC